MTNWENSGPDPWAQEVNVWNCTLADLKCFFSFYFYLNFLFFTFLSFYVGEIEVGEDVNWIKANFKQTGYYRVNYDEGNWKALIDQLNYNHTV